jgi:outer membrane autotransporter protein
LGGNGGASQRGGGGGGGIYGAGGAGSTNSGGFNYGAGGGGGGVTGGTSASGTSGGNGAGGAAGGTAGQQGQSGQAGGGGGGGGSGANGGAGGELGGGGGGGYNNSGASGGDFGGGGGAAQPREAHTTGGSGGFGGGGGGAAATGGGGSSSGAGGFGAGNGGAARASGGAGSGYGGAVFVRDGGTLTVVDSTFTDGSVAAGTGSTAGSAAGTGLFLHGGTQLGVVADNNTTIVDNIAGTGGLEKSGAASLTLSGANTYTGPTDVQAGRLAIDGSITSDTTVQSGASLGGHGTITGDVTNHGTLAPGNSIGTLTIDGNYSDSASSTMQVEINSAGTTPGVNNDLTVLNGTATLSGGTVNVQAASGGTYTVGSRYVFLEATSLTGTFSSITGFHQPGLQAVLGYGDILIGSTSYMTAYFDLIAGQADFAAIATTPNQLGIATYIDDNSLNPSADMQALIDTLNSLTVPEQQAALDEMTGQVNGTLAQLNVQGTTFMYMMLRRRVGSAFAAGGMAGGSSGGGFLAEGESAAARRSAIMPVSFTSSNSKSCSLVNCTASQPRSAWGGWTAGYGLGGNAQTDGNAAGGLYGSGGMITAIERPLDDATLVGFFGAYSNMSVNLSGLPQSAVANQGQFGSYLLRDLGPSYWLAAGSVGFTGYHESRQMTFGNINSTATANYNGWNPTAYLERGVRWQSGQAIVQPYAALQYLYVRQNSFTESGAGLLDQTISGIDTHALRGLLGARIARPWLTETGRVLTPELRAAWMHEFLEPSSTLNAVFAPIGGGTFAAQGLNFGRDWALLGTGTQYVYNQHVSLFANYDLLFNAQQAWNAGSGGIQFTW